MINPAHMTRQISEITEQKGIFCFNITSLKPVNPNNKSDDWEREQIIKFEKNNIDEFY
jgi:hypothetical protein